MNAVIVSTARTPLCKSWKGALNMTHGAKMGGHVVHAALDRAKVDCQEVDDVIMGCANPEGATGWNIARQIALRAGCPITTPGMTVNRFCSSGLQTIALAAQRIMAGEGDVFVAGGVESISLVQNEMNKHHFQDEWLHRHHSEIYWPMLQTAECVARRYEITREDQDRYGVQSQQRAAKARAEGKTKDEIVPITVKMKVVDKNSGQESMREVIASEDEGIRPDTTYEGVSKIKPAIEGGVISAGNASQFSDGASIAIVMSAATAANKGLTPLGLFRGFAVAGCEPNEMGIGPVFAVPKLLERTGTKVEDAVAPRSPGWARGGLGGGPQTRARGPAGGAHGGGGVWGWGRLREGARGRGGEGGDLAFTHPEKAIAIQQGEGPGGEPRSGA